MSNSDHNARLGNTSADSGSSRCECGCKYWQNDRCIDCGTVHDPARHDVDTTCINTPYFGICKRDGDDTLVVGINGTVLAFTSVAHAESFIAEHSLEGFNVQPLEREDDEDFLVVV